MATLNGQPVHVVLAGGPAQGTMIVLPPGTQKHLVHELAATEEPLKDRWSDYTSPRVTEYQPSGFVDPDNDIDVWTPYGRALPAVEWMRDRFERSRHNMVELLACLAADNVRLNRCWCGSLNGHTDACEAASRLLKAP